MKQLLYAPDAVASAPAPTPSAAPQPAAAPQPSPESSPSPAPPSGGESPSGDGDFMSELAKHDADFMPAKEPEKPAEKKEPAKPTVDPKTKPEPLTKEGNAKLRAELERTRADLEARNKAQSDLEAKIKDWEEKGKNTEVLTRKLADMDKAISEKEGELRKYRFQTSPEFQKNYKQPFDDAVTEAMDEFGHMQVGQYVVNQDTDQREFKPVEKADFNKHFRAIYQLDRPEALKRINEVFAPEDAALVASHYTELHRQQRRMERAEGEERTNWEKRNQEEAATTAQRAEAAQKDYTSALKDLETKLPELYAPDPTDPETEKRLSLGRQMLDYKPKTYAEAIAHRARLNANAAAFPMMQYKYGKVIKELAEAKEKIQAMTNKGPQPGKKTGEATAKDPNAPLEGDEFLAAAREAMAGIT
jgi:hypothetical protein